MCRPPEERASSLPGIDVYKRQVNVGTELTGEAEGLDKAVQHGVAPVVHRFAQLHRALRNAGPEGAVVVQGVGQLHPFRCV